MSTEHPLCPTRSYVTESKRELFLAALKERRLNVSAARRAAGLASTGGVYSGLLATSSILIFVTPSSMEND